MLKRTLFFPQSYGRITMHKLFAIFLVLYSTTLAFAADAPVPDLGKRKAGVDWPVFLGPTADSKSSETGIVTKWKAGTPRIVWQKKLGTGYGIGSVSRGRLLQFDRYGDQARLSCWNAETGAELWKFEYASDYEDLYNYNNGPRCSPLIDGDRVYIFGVEGMLHCVQLLDGKLLWKFDTDRKFGVVQNFFGVGSSPVIHGDLLLVMVGGSPADSHNLPPGQLDRVEPNGTAVVAFDKRTGEVRYKVGDDLASYASLRIATVNKEPFCLAFCRAGLLAFDPRTGKQDFHFPWRSKILESVNAATPTIVADQILISETYGPGSALLNFARGKKEIVWQDDPKKREKTLLSHWCTPVHHAGFGYGCSGRHTHEAMLRCFDWKTGTVKWSEPGLTRASLLYVDGHFVGLGEYGQLFLFKANPEKFELIAELELTDPVAGPLLPGAAGGGALLKYPCWAAPILSHGLLYVRGDDRLVCVELIPEKK